MVDTSLWDETHKIERQMSVVLAVTTCVSMLKKEVDRRRGQQMAVLAAGASGGGS